MEPSVRRPTTRRRQWVQSAIAAVAIAIGGCNNRLTEPTRSALPPASSAQSVHSGFGTASVSEIVPWGCVAVDAGAERPANCPARMLSMVSAAGAVAAPGTPVSLIGTTSDNRVALAWLAPLGGDPPASYVVQAGSAPGLSNLADFDTGTAAPSFNTDGVPQGTYYIRVRARNAAGLSAVSNELTLTVGATGCLGGPNAPTGLAASVTGSRGRWLLQAAV